MGVTFAERLKAMKKEEDAEKRVRKAKLKLQKKECTKEEIYRDLADLGKFMKKNETAEERRTRGLKEMAAKLDPKKLEKILRESKQVKLKFGANSKEYLAVKEKFRQLVKESKKVN